MAIKGNAQIEWRVLFFCAFVSLLGISLISYVTACREDRLVTVRLGDDV